jgi:hypothetical protein
VIGFIGLENPMVQQRMPLERIIKPAQFSMHHIPVQGPFKEGVSDNSQDEP